MFRLQPPCQALCLLIVATILSGCAQKPTGPLYLHPAFSPDPRYSVKSGGAVFKDNRIRVWARPVSRAEGLPALLKRLIDEDYRIFVLGIENISNEKVIYNPSRTALMDNALGYRKPLDYTDLYMSERNKDMGLVHELRGRFYDLDVTLAPGEKVSRYIIFKPVAEGSTKAVLVLKALYIGTDTVDVKLPFTLEPEKEE